MSDQVIHKASISRLQAVSRCATAAYLRYDCHARPETEAPHFFVGHNLHAGIEAYYRGEYDTVFNATMDILEKDLIRRGLTQKQIDAAYSIGKIETDILSKFSSGEIKKKDGSLYTAPKMTTAYKDLAKSTGLFSAIHALDGVTIGGCFDEELREQPPVNLKDDGVHGIVGRISMLAKRYQETILVPREAFEEIHLEEEFEFDEVLENGEIVRFFGFMDLWGKLKPEYRAKYSEGKAWVLIDYKSGKAKLPDEHAASADESLQLTLYDAALTKTRGVPQEDLHITLHFLDAAYVAPTERQVEDFDVLLPLAEAYVASKGTPGLPKRLLYSANMDCQYCEIKKACEKKFGFSTKSAGARAAAKEALVILNQLAEG